MQEWPSIGSSHQRQVAAVCSVVTGYLRNARLDLGSCGPNIHREAGGTQRFGPLARTARTLTGLSSIHAAWSIRATPRPLRRISDTNRSQDLVHVHATWPVRVI